MIFVPVWYCPLFLFFQLLCRLFGSSLFSSWWDKLKVYQVCLSFWKTSSHFLWYFLLVSIFISPFTFIISFLLLNLGFFVLFLIPLRGRLCFFIWDFSYFWRKASIGVNFLEQLLLHPIDFGKLWWKVVFPFSFILFYFLISSLISSLTH